jgi:hypothetical protein
MGLSGASPERASVKRLGDIAERLPFSVQPDRSQVAQGAVDRHQGLQVCALRYRRSEHQPLLAEVPAVPIETAGSASCSRTSG